MRRAVVIVCVSLASGCYLAHERDGAPRRDAGSGGVDSGMRDSGRRDAGPAPPLPDEPPPDPGPDARPSDDGDGWREPPPPDPSRPCCTAVTGTTEIDVGEDAGGDVAITWTDGGWAVMYTSIGRTLFQELARDATPIGTPRRHEPGALGVDLAWRGERVATVISREGDGDEQDSTFGLLDRHGALAAGWTDVPLTYGASITHLDHLDRFLVASTGPTVHALGRDAALLGEVPLEAWPYAERPRLVGLKSRAVMFDLTTESAVGATIIPASLAPEPRFVAHAWRSAEEADSATMVGTTSLRDEAIAVIGGSTRSMLVAVDPFRRTAESVDTVPAPPSASRAFDDVVGLDEPGLVAICFASFAAADETPVELHIVGRDGLPRGGPIVVEDEPGHRSRCALGWSGDTLFVAWTAYWSDAIRVRGYAIE